MKGSSGDRSCTQTTPKLEIEVKSGKIMEKLCSDVSLAKQI